MEAKKAVTDGSSPINKLPPSIACKKLPISVQARRKLLLKGINSEWRLQWEKSPRCTKYDSLRDSFPFSNHQEIANGLTHAQYSILTQIKSGHIPLNIRLARMKKIASSQCEKCWTRDDDKIPETICYFLFECPEYNGPRSQLDAEMGQDSRSLGTLLALKEGTKSLLKYIGRTKRLQVTFGNVIPRLLRAS